MSRRTRRLLGSVRLRMAVAAMVVVGATLGLGATFLVSTVEDRLVAAGRRDSVNAINVFESMLTAGVPLDSGAFMPVQPGGIHVRVMTPDGRVLPTDAGALFFEAQPMQITTDTLTLDSGSFAISAADPLGDVHRSVQTLSGLLRIVVPLIVVLAGAGGWLLAGRSLRPVEQLRAEVEQITHTTLGRRVRATGGDEVARLGGTMNNMLDRLERASIRQRQFVSDASHELRSPLAAMRSDLEVALAHPGADWPYTVRQTLKQTTRLESLIGELLASDDTDRTALAAGTPVDLDDLVLERAAVLRRTSPIRIDTTHVSGGRVLGARAALERAVGNVMENACRHARSTVRVELTTSEHDVRIAVDDDGPGVPPDQRDFIFERFTRLNEARSRDTGGTGLGLAIVRNTITRHGGTVTCTDSPLGGARFEIVLPTDEPKVNRSRDYVDSRSC